mgnify:CR=1 FL=1
MKKSILSLIAGAIVALASCSQSDDMPGQPQEGVQTATFTIQTPAATRTTVTGLSRYIVEAYEGSTAMGTPAARVEEATGTLTLGLKKNTEYTFLFWADKGTPKAGSSASSGYWNTDNLKAVTITSGKESTAGEAAYCFAQTFNSANFEANKEVTLKNATAQVCFIETAGLSAADNTLEVTYSAGGKLNVGTGSVTDVAGAITHTFTNIGQATANTTLATDYILAPTGEDRVLNLTIQLNTEVPKTIPNVPFRQCFITNIKGEYSTLGRFTFSVTANDTWKDPDKDYDFTATNWDGKYPTSVSEAKQWLGTEVEGATDTNGKNHVFEISTAKQLVAIHYLITNNAIVDNTVTSTTYNYPTYRLKADINLNNHPWTPIGIKQGVITSFLGVFDGQGHTISGLNVSANTYGCYSFCAINDGTFKYLTVKGKVEYTGTGGVSIGGIAGDNTGTIAFCSFEGTVKTTQENIYESRLGWICGKNIQGASSSQAGQITSCFAKGTISGSTSVVMGGMTAINTYPGGYSGTIAGCTWYYKQGATPEGIAACYSGWTSGDDNNSYSLDTELSARVSAMNQLATNYDYQWQADGSTLKLVAKTQ